MTWTDFVRHVEKEIKLYRPGVDLDTLQIYSINVYYPTESDTLVRFAGVESPREERNKLYIRDKKDE